MTSSRWAPEKGENEMAAGGGGYAEKVDGKKGLGNENRYNGGVEDGLVGESTRTRINFPCECGATIEVMS